MAKKVFANLTVKIGADTKQFTNQMRKTQRRTKGLSQQFSALKTMAIGALGVYGAGSIIKNAINKNIQFEKSMADVKAITKATGEQLALLEKDALKLGASTEHTASSVAGLQKEFGKLGFSTEEILNATSATLDLATATGEELAISAEVAGATIRGFGKDAKETRNVVDLMAASFTSSALDLNRWQESMKHAAPIAKAAGIEIEEVAAMLAILADAGISGSMAGTTMKKIISELAVEGKTMSQVIAELADENIGLAEAEDLVGERAKAGILVLTDNADKLRELTKEYGNVSDAAKDMSAIIRDTLSGDLKILSSAWEGVILKGKAGVGVLRGLVQMVTTLISEMGGKGQGFFGKSLFSGFKKFLSPGALFDDLFNPKEAVKSIVGINAQIRILKGELEKVGKASWKSLEAPFDGAAAELEKGRILTAIALLEDEVISLGGVLDDTEEKVVAVASIWEQMAGEAVGVAAPIITEVHTWEKSLSELQAQITENNKALQETKDIGIAQEYIAENKALEEQIRLRKIQLGLTPQHGTQTLGKLAPIGAGPISLGIAPEGIKASEQAMLGLTNATISFGNELANVGEISVNMAGMIGNAFMSMADIIGDAIGDMLSGTADAGSILKSIIGVIAQFLRGLGSALVAAGIAAGAFESLLENPPAAIAAGLALIATSALVMSLMSNTPTLAGGGLAYGPTLAMVGDNAGARSDPEVIAPLSKLSGMMGSKVMVEGQFRIRGTDLVLVLDKANDNINQYS